ncbi:MAG: hypothetical protein ACFFFC_13455 [Candidatus Thorarchaeota archaeon]
MAIGKSAGSWSKQFQGISLVGLALVPLMLTRAVMNSPMNGMRLQIVGISFIIICLLGGIAGIRPSTCSTSLFHRSKQGEVEKHKSLHARGIARRGHHYTCDDFSMHVLNIGEHVFCAGCTGLSTGAALSILGSVLYFMMSVPLIAAEIIFWIGFGGVTVGIVQHKIYRSVGNVDGFFRFLLNVFFVAGAFMLLISADQLVGSLFVDSYILLLVLFWIYTRIAMSNSEHHRICSQCNSELCQNS